jgi:cell division septation protein DedD
MRYRRVLISTVAISLLTTTGCVKPTDEPNQTINPNTNNNNNNEVVYDEQPTSVVYEDSTPIIYSDPVIMDSSAGVDYGTVEETVVSTGGYEQPTSSVISTGPFDDPYAEVGGSSSSSTSPTISGGSDVYVDPYASGGGTATPSYTPPAPTYTTPSSSTYTTDTSYSGTSSSGGGGGIHLQVAALRDYYAAQEFKNSLSLPPQYSAYVKKGAMNKVIIKGFSSRSEAKALADRQFPGAFIVAGSSSSSTYTPPAPSYSPPSYTPPTSSAPVGSSNSGIGVQVGAFSSQSSARSAAESSAAGRYTAIVKTVTVRGKTLYKAILLGFNSRAEAKSAIASGQIPNGFVVSNIYP